MKILYIRETDVKYDPRVQKEVNSLIKNNRHSVTIISWNRNHNSPLTKDYLELPNGKVDVVYIGIKSTWGGGPRKNFKSIIRFISCVKKWLKKNKKYDAIHFCTLPIACSVLRIAKRLKMKIIYDIFDYYPDLRKNNRIIRKILVALENYAIKNADATIICNENRISQIGNAKYKKLEIIHNSPASFAFGNCKLLSSTDKVKFVYVGNLIEDRMIPLLLDFFRKNNKYEFHVGGIGILSKEVENAAATCDNIFYYGKLKYNDVLQLERQCDVFVALYDPSIPNHKYVAANKFYEALYLGKPLIMCKRTGLDETIDKELIGVSIEPSLDSLESGIVKLVSNSDSWGEISLKEKALFDNKYSWDIMEKRLLSLYENL